MNTFTKVKKMVTGLGALALAAAPAFATPAIANSTLDGLPDMGSDIGGFMTNMAPGVGTFILIIGVFVAVAGIVAAIGFLIRKAVVK